MIFGHRINQGTDKGPGGGVVCQRTRKIVNQRTGDVKWGRVTVRSGQVANVPWGFTHSDLTTNEGAQTVTS